ncbi:hypothetical protein BpHYR1_019129 [Brachionus plicatilis]|uniref:Uncharacterized protein n=1 Tax=Brachionus plicatilis TaxID=10195 RepID=A0A3M7RH12_BRAPC|nr:hypothetical protein BpHYR1_019129 [Brachionus plicatilis]
MPGSIRFPTDSSLGIQCHSNCICFVFPREHEIFHQDHCMAQHLPSQDRQRPGSILSPLFEAFLGGKILAFWLCSKQVHNQSQNHHHRKESILFLPPQAFLLQSPNLEEPVHEALGPRDHSERRARSNNLVYKFLGDVPVQTKTQPCPH